MSFVKADVRVLASGFPRSQLLVAYLRLRIIFRTSPEPPERGLISR